MSLFTFVLEYVGGTYISQYCGRTPREALRRWAKGEGAALIGQWSPRTVDELFASVVTDEPTALSEVDGVWFVSALAAGKRAQINIIRTQESRSGGRT